MSKTAGKFIVVAERGAVVKEVPADDSLDAMQKAVGGYIELFLQMQSKSRPDATIDFYCNEEGRLIDLEPNVLVDAGDGYKFDIVGPVLITAGNDKTGETLGLTEEELRAVRVYPNPNPFAEWKVVKYG